MQNITRFTVAGAEDGQLFLEIRRMLRHYGRPCPIDGAVSLYKSPQRHELVDLEFSRSCLIPMVLRGTGSE